VGNATNGWDKLPNHPTSEVSLGNVWVRWMLELAGPLGVEMGNDGPREEGLRAGWVPWLEWW
jgi:hypothetical protein